MARNAHALRRTNCLGTCEMKDGVREEEARTDSPGKWATFGVDLNKSSQTYFLFSFALHANIMQKGKRRGPKYKELNGQSGGHATGQEAWLSSQGVHKMASECGGCHCKCYKSV